MKYFVIFCMLQTTLLQDLPPKFRLQYNAIPKSYNLKIRPYIDEGCFTGEVTIFVKLQKSLVNITLNIKNLQISRLVLDSSVNNTGYEIDPENELVNIFFKDGQLVDPGEHLIYVNFTGMLTSNSQGFFKSEISSEGMNLDGVATMFSASDARSVFPCFDDPVYKSEFTIRFILPNNTYTALSNMEETNSMETDNGLIVDFRTTPPISPYLVCFVMTRYNFTKTFFKSIDGRIIPIRLFQLNEYKDQGPYLLEAARRSLQFFEEYTNIAYPLNKLDLIELKDFIFEGMENIGLVTLTHHSVSFDESKFISKIEHQTNAAQLIIHEISHMWFGDIVTHLWYNDLWITEGFAEFMEIKGIDNQHPDWKMVELEALIRHRAVYNYDIQPKQIPSVVAFPETHGQVEEQFEDLIYSKGSAILTMLEMVMGANAFQMGVREHLKRHYFSLSTTGDFIETMQQFAPQTNLWGFLSTWLYQNRYPLVVVTKDPDSDNYIIRQKNFVLAPYFESIFGHKWTIPITYISSCNKTMNLKWLDKDSEMIYIPRCKGEKWIKFNHESKAYFRVLYTQDQYKQLLDHFNELNDVDQAHLIDETFHLMRKLQISCEIPLKFIGKLKSNGRFLSILVAVKAIKRTLSDIAGDSTLFLKFKEYVLSIFKDFYDKLTWTVDEGDNFSKRMLRASILNLLCLKPLNFEKCAEDVDRLNKSGLLIHPDVSHIFNRVLKTSHQKHKRNENKKFDNTEKIRPRNATLTQIFMETCKLLMFEDL